jgi:hypothetical protein
MDEKPSIQALDHTQASLPMTKGRAGTTTSDYKRHGTGLAGGKQVGAAGRACCTFSDPTL